MSETIIHRNYCMEHAENDHWLTENGQCMGRDLDQVQRRGLVYKGHIGGGWFVYYDKYEFYDLGWEMAADANDTARSLEPDF